MKEILRLQHVRYVDELGMRLEDFNLTVFAGETVCLLGVHGSGKSGLKRLLSGDNGIVSGMVYFREQPVVSGRKAVFANTDVQITNGLDALVGSLSITENLFLLRRRKGIKLWFNACDARTETSHILAEFGIECSADTRIDRLSCYDRYLLCVAKAASYGAKLLVLDLADTAFSFQQACALAQHVERLQKERGLSFLILGDEYEPLLQCASRVVILQDGIDVCTMYREEFSMSRLERYLSVLSVLPEENGGVTVAQAPAGDRKPFWEIRANRDALLCACKGEIIGVIDTLRNTGADLNEYLKRLMRLSGFHVALLDAEGYANDGMVCIPENSAEMLIESLSIGDNLMMPAHRRAARFGIFLSPAATRLVVREYDECAIVSGECKKVRELTRIQRKILSIQRWLLTRPRALVLENPDSGLNLHDRAEIYRYLAKVSAEGTAVFVITHNALKLQEHCDYMILAADGRITKVFQRKSFRAERFLFDHHY